MTRISCFLILISLFTFKSFALEGYDYGVSQNPTGDEWESPQKLAYNKELPHAIFYTFENLESAMKVLPENSKYWKSLDGKWKFNWVPTPESRPKEFFKPDYDTSGWDEINVPSNWTIEGIQKNGEKKYGTPIYVNQPVIFWHEIKPGDWKEGVMRTPPKDWTTYTDRNEVGSYRRTFTVPHDWKNREIYINFNGVDSFFYLWINGNYVGFSKNSRNLASFNITKYLIKGENTVAVEVYRNSDGSFLESQDMFRLPGIFRSVYLTSTNKIQFSDLKAIPDLSTDYKDGTLAVTATIRNLSNKDVKDLKVEYKLYQNKLYSDEHEPGKSLTFSSNQVSIENGEENEILTLFNLQDPKKWSAEQPWRYTLVAQLKDKKGKVLETVSTYVGFRKVEILDTPADQDEFGLQGRYFYINGKPVKLKGVNRHETDPSRGHSVSHERMEDEVMMMKRANINQVRHSHYPDDPYWYYLAEKYGLYLEDEANLESHEYYYGDASLSHVPEWEAAHVARNLEMVNARINSPAVVIWSLGNEAGPGENFVTAYNAIKAIDTSRPIQYERNNTIVDMGSNQYPSIPWVQEAVKGEMDIKYPFHISEYAHSMGNAVGNLIDYCNAIESTNFFMGGAIWDWIDQSLYNYDSQSGDKYLAFGGDFGDNPSDGQFVMNGILFGDLTPKPQYWEVKKVYQNVGVSPVDILNGEIEIFNKNYFTDLDDYLISWELIENGNSVLQGELPSDTGKTLEPRKKVNLNLPFDKYKFDEGKEYFLNLYFNLKENKPWAKAGFVQMEEQIPVKLKDNVSDNMHALTVSPLNVEENDSLILIKGDGFNMEFDNSKGTLQSLNFGGKDFIIEGKGPELDVFRAYLNNDNWISDQWFANGLYNLQHKVIDHETGRDDNGNLFISYILESQAPNGGKMIGGNGNSSGTYSIDETGFEPFGDDDFKIFTNQIWTIFPDGTIELNSYFDSNNPSLTLPRLGYSMEMPDNFYKVNYYGRGPEENYSDRKTGQFIGKYETTVKDMFTNYTRPQSNGNREEVEWASINDEDSGLLFMSPQKMSFSVLPYSEMELFEANHPYKLPNNKKNVLHLDYGVTGLGGSSCGQGGPLEPDRITASDKRFSFIIKKNDIKSTTEPSSFKTAGLLPIGMNRSKFGVVTLDYPGKDVIIYSIDGGKTEQVYDGPFNFKNGGTVKAWLKNNPRINSQRTFKRIDKIPVVVASASSEEPDSGEASNIVDGNPSTIWNTMYSVTVTPFPHWVDFDAGETKEINGVTYLPRQGRNNVGMIKDYEIYVSENLKDWGSPVAKGSFNSDKEKKIINFPNPVKGRYIRFKALNALDGKEYATGAEFEVLAD